MLRYAALCTCTATLAGICTPSVNDSQKSPPGVVLTPACSSCPMAVVSCRSIPTASLAHYRPEGLVTHLQDRIPFRIK
ncbi:hypothetical protein J3E74DRAFT_33578 [Bipolaris maydis]|nr:hypothetical protein J3E74DRAFT_33578 [Bipolaris maydis]